jgi:N-acetylneuraminate synthase
MNRVILVAEIGINHNGDINIAKKLIDVAHIAGCDYVKFQKRTIAIVYPPEVLNKYRESPWGTTNSEQKYGLEFGQDEYDQIDEYCRKKRIGWFASPWDVESVKFLRQYRPKYMKVASACITDRDLLDRMFGTSAEIILSTGMSTRDELSQALSKVGNRTRHILACTSTYPTKDEEMNLNFIKTLQDQLPVYHIGFSNHSPGIQYSVVAAALGAKMIEFHITLDRAMYGSDQAASIETGGVMALCKHVRNLEKAMGTGEWTVFESEEGVKKGLRRF